MSGTYSMSFKNATSAPLGSVLLSHASIDNNGNVDSGTTYQWALFSVPASSSTYTTPGTFTVKDHNEFAITFTDQNNFPYGCFVHTGVSSSSSGTVTVTLSYSSGAYSVNINDGHGNSSSFAMGLLASTYGFAS